MREKRRRGGGGTVPPLFCSFLSEFPLPSIAAVAERALDDDGGGKRGGRIKKYDGIGAS